MYYIYCYINKINNHKYIGQTNNFKRRIRQHKSIAYNKNSKCYNDLFHKKIRQYGIDNFNIIILEKGSQNDYRYINEREQYWIKEKQSYCGTGLGYNMDHGGSNKGYSSYLSQEQINQLKKELKDNQLTYYQLQNKYNISASFLSSINHGNYFFEETNKYPLRKYYKDNEDYDELIELLTNSTLSIREIAKQLNIGLSTITKINNGQLRSNMYPSYPIRKEDPRKIRSKQIAKLLLETNLSIQEIAKAVNVSDETVRRVNKGTVFKNNNLIYPLRNL